MKTDELMAVLVAAQRPVDTALLSRNLLVAAALSLVITAVLVVAILGARADLVVAVRDVPLAAKAAFGAALALTGLVAFLRSLRPGRPARPLLRFAVLPLAAIVAWGVWTLATAPVGDWGALTFGRNWQACLIAVPLYAMLPFAALLAVARRGAPVDLDATGLAAGIASAGLAIVGYSLHCTDDTAPFIATWYPIATAIVAAFGTVAGRRLLRW